MGLPAILVRYMLRLTSPRTQPLVLVVDKAGAQNRKALARYFSESAFEIYEATDAFDVIDELCDFTVRERHDVITVPSGASDFAMIADLINQSVGPAADFPVFLYSDNSEFPSAFHTVEEVDEWFSGPDRAAAVAH